MLHLKVRKINGERIRRELLKKKVLDEGKKIFSKDVFLFFPIRKRVKVSGTEIVNLKGEEKEKKQTIEDFLKGTLTVSELKLIPKSFDVIGEVLVLELNEKLEKKKSVLGKAFLKANTHVKTVLRKKSEREGEFRTRNFEILAGEKNTETVHQEYGCFMKLDVAKVYFSPREALERQRIANLVKDGERVLVMFSGIAPFAIHIAKKQKNCEISCIDSNPDAIRYADENSSLNKVAERVKNYCRDAGKIPEKFGKFDRIVMPLPKGAYKFLDNAIPLLKENGILHFYYWSKEDDLFSEAEKLIKEKAKKFKKRVKFLEEKKVLPYAPRTWKVVLDVQISSE